MLETAQKSLIWILNKSRNENCYAKALTKSLVDYQIKPYNIMKLYPEKVLQIYRSISKKFYSQAESHETDSWAQNQLRIFVWVVVVFAFVEQKQIEEITELQWKMLSQIFNNKSPIALQFQCLCLMRLKKSKKWSQQQIKLLNDSIQDRCQKNRWNQIAKSIFLASDKKYFRTPKQCRQQWLNHLDPSKTKSQWTVVQDYLLIKNIINNGRKWSKVAKLIGNHRTQHMVKNRFKSLINAQMKRLPDVDKEQILVAKIRQRLECHPTIRKYLTDQGIKLTKTQSQYMQYQYQKMPERYQQTVHTQDSQQNSNMQQEMNIDFTELQQASCSQSLQQIEVNVKNQQKFKTNEQFWQLKQQPDIDDLDAKQLFNGQMFKYDCPESIQYFTSYQ